MFQCFHEIQIEITSFFKIQSRPFSLTYSVTFCLAINYFSARFCRLGQSQAQITPQKAIGSVKHDSPFINPWWLFPAISLSLIYLEMVSGEDWSEWTEVKWPGLLFSSSCPPWRQGVAFAFSPMLKKVPSSQHFKDNKKWHQTAISQLPVHWTYRFTPSGSMRLYVSG